MTENVTHVMVNSRIYDGSTMDEIGNHLGKRAPFYCEREGVDNRFIWHPSDAFEIEGGETCLCGRHETSSEPASGAMTPRR